MGKRIAIVAGHLEQDKGASKIIDGITYAEYDLARKVTDEVFAQIAAMDGIDAKQFYGMLTQKVDAINAWHADIAVEVHFNRTPKNNKTGTETLYDSESKEGKRLATVLQKELVRRLGTTSRGAKVGWYRGVPANRLYFLSYTRMPAAIIEVCFLNKPDIEKVIGVPPRELWYVAPATAIVQGILNYFQDDKNASNRF